jgi:hypothetical protein
LEVVEVLYVLNLIMNLFLVLEMEDRGYIITFEDGQVLIRSKGFDLDLGRVFGVREGKVYRLQGKPVSGSMVILDHGSMSVAKDE